MTRISNQIKVLRWHIKVISSTPGLAIALQVSFAITMPSWLRPHLYYITLLCLWLGTKSVKLISIFPWQLFLAALWQFVPTYTVTLVAISMSHLFRCKIIFYIRWRFSHTDQRGFCSFWKPARQSTNINCIIIHFFHFCSLEITLPQSFQIEQN